MRYNGSNLPRFDFVSMISNKMSCGRFREYSLRFLRIMFYETTILNNSVEIGFLPNYFSELSKKDDFNGGLNS